MSQRYNNSATATITVVLTIEGAGVISITMRGSPQSLDNNRWPTRPSAYTIQESGGLAGY